MAAGNAAGIKLKRDGVRLEQLVDSLAWMAVEEPLMDARCENVYFKRRPNTQRRCVEGGRLGVLRRDVNTAWKKTVLRPAVGLNEREI